MPENTQKYQTANAFRRAIEDRLKNISKQQSVPLDRLRRRVAFDRLLARLFDRSSPALKWILKGGYALEFRYQNIARATKDIDFTIPHVREMDSDKIRELLQDGVEKDVRDWFVFFVGTQMQEFDQTVYGGWRYPVDARLDNRTFTKFHVDVGVGDAIVSEPEWQEGEDILDFAGILPAYVAMLPKDQHFSEKLHAYTYPVEKRAFSRIRDLVDLVLLIEQGLPKKEIMLKAVEATFERRNTHNIPEKLEPPPDILKQSYREMAEECGVTKKSMIDAFRLFEEYWEKISS